MRNRFGSVLVVIASVMTGCAEVTAPESEASQGFNSLFIGHSFFRPIADGLPFHAGQAGIVEHEQAVVFAGGANGAPLALWNNAAKRAEIQAVLDQGDVELFGMTYARTYPTTEGYERWIGYALQRNPDTRFFIGLPWSDFPAEVDGSTYAQSWLEAHEGWWHDFVESIRALFPGVEIFCIPYGRSALELRNLLDAGALPDIETLTGSADEAIFTDAKGHAGGILKELARLVWLEAIYGVDLRTYEYDPGYTTDLKLIAQDIAVGHDPYFGRASR
ncbi:MAG: hypothetical protein OXU33_01245 [Gemmatimonadota bacterium]|nr:hypothetical protein [Gemmatimonadota bacterium]